MTKNVNVNLDMDTFRRKEELNKGKDKVTWIDVIMAGISAIEAAQGLEKDLGDPDHQ